MSEMDGSRCMTSLISTSSNGLYLHLSKWDGAFLAIISSEAILTGEVIAPFDVEVVYTRREAVEWFDDRRVSKPWEGWHDQTRNAQHRMYSG